MPAKITLDEGIAAAQSGQRITLDEALAHRDAQTRIGGQQDVRQGEELVKGEGLPGSPNYRPPTIAPRPKEATEANFGAAFKNNMIEDVDTKRRVIAETLFPGDSSAVSRVGFAQGRPVFLDDNGELQFVSSTAGRFAGAVAGNAPEAVGATVGSFSSSPVIGAALGAAGAKGIKRAVAGVLWDEPQTIGGNLKEVTGEAALTAGMGVAGKGLSKLVDRGKTVDFSPASRGTAEQTVNDVKQNTGIDIDLAQASGDRKLISLRQYAARYPGKSAELIQAADDAAAGQFETAASKVLDKIAASKPSEVYGRNAVNAAKAAIKDVTARRDALVSPYYEAAKKVTLGADVVTELSDDPLVARAARRIAADPVYQRKLKDLSPDSVGYWQQVKRNLDAGYETAATSGNKTAAIEYADAAKIVNNRLAAASPEYKQANDFYAAATRDIVEPLQNSAVGVISQIKDPGVAKAAAKIFSDANLSPQALAEARAVISKKNPEAWDGLVRQWLGQRLNQAMKVTQTGSELNVAGKFRQSVFGTPTDRQKMSAMLPAGVVQDFENLMFAAQKLASTPIAGSNTMRDTEIKDQLKGTGAVIFRWLTSPRKQVVDSAEQRALEQGTHGIAEALLDPAKRSQLRRVVKMAPSTRQAIMITSILSGQSLKVAAQSEEALMPPASREARSR